jgi:hypothetical protein
MIGRIYLLAHSAFQSKQLYIMKTFNYSKLTTKVILSIFLLSVASCNTGTDLVNPIQEIDQPSVDTKHFESWFIDAVNETSNRARTASRDKVLSPSDYEFPLWKKAKAVSQKDNNTELIVLPNFKRRGQEVVLQKLVFYRDKDKTEGFRVEFYPEGPQNEKVNGSLKIISINEDSQKVIQFKESQIVSTRGRLASTQLDVMYNVPIDLNVVVHQGMNQH